MALIKKPKAKLTSVQGASASAPKAAARAKAKKPSKKTTGGGSSSQNSGGRGSVPGGQRLYSKSPK